MDALGLATNPSLSPTGELPEIQSRNLGTTEQFSFGNAKYLGIDVLYFQSNAPAYTARPVIVKISNFTINTNFYITLLTSSNSGMSLTIVSFYKISDSVIQNTTGKTMTVTFYIFR